MKGREIGKLKAGMADNTSREGQESSEDVLRWKSHQAMWNYCNLHCQGWRSVPQSPPGLVAELAHEGTLSSVMVTWPQPKEVNDLHSTSSIPAII